MMASIIHKTHCQPWGYYVDMSRQLWDEARHAMLGEVGFVALGVDWSQARITHNWSLRLNIECTPLERHAVLYFIEQGLMTKTGKRYEWEVGVASGLPLLGTIQDFDWADEVLHAQLGRQWYIPQVGDWKQTVAYGNQCWSRILSNWQTVRDRGLTRHENCWPAIYLQVCRSWSTPPDPKVLAFDTTYEAQRADLQTVSGPRIPELSLRPLRSVVPSAGIRRNQRLPDWSLAHAPIHLRVVLPLPGPSRRMARLSIER